MRQLCTARMYGHTHTGRTARAGEGVESRDGLGDERTKAAQACSGTKWYCVGKRADRGGVEFQMRYTFVRSRDRYVWTAESTRSRQGRYTRIRNPSNPIAFRQMIYARRCGNASVMRGHISVTRSRIPIPDIRKPISKYLVQLSGPLPNHTS
jgi:hypothetical protein